jgi:formylglycine-generating enzyme required for sulfatase activity
LRTVTESGQLLGSIPWASPEQVSGGSAAVDAGSDVYSLGVMLYQAITGQFPYEVEGHLYDVLPRIAKADVAAPSTRPDCRPIQPAQALDAIVLKALAKCPGDRYSNAGELAKDLAAFLDGRPVQAPSPRRAWRWSWQLGAIITALIAVPLVVLTRSPVRPPNPPGVFELPSIQNSVGMRLVRVPSAAFWMGERSPMPAEHSLAFGQVEVQSFYIAVTEVTQQQYERVMGGPAPEQVVPGPNLPVHNISYGQAIEFCERLSGAEGRTYRLPHEDEWEYACRAGSTQPYFGTEGIAPIAWYAGNSAGRVHPCAQKWANAWGLYDVHGNVKEWCDWPRRADPAGTQSFADVRIVRGGGAQSDQRDCLATSRQPRDEGRRAQDIGFRVALDVRR